MMMGNRLWVLSLLLLIAPYVQAADVQERTAEKILAAKGSPDRPEADRERDPNRKPIRTLMFFELADNARVLELFPGAGWYTRILSDVLADEGELFVALGTSRVREIEQELAPMQILETGTRLIPTATYGIFDLDSNLREFRAQAKSLHYFEC